jgi:hypothetical protein
MTKYEATADTAPQRGRPELYQPSRVEWLQDPHYLAALRERNELRYAQRVRQEAADD